jgi:hypothetical protein
MVLFGSVPTFSRLPSGPDQRKASTPNRAKAAICIAKTMLTIANKRYTSLREDGSNFIGQPPSVAERIIFASKILS